LFTPLNEGKSRTLVQLALQFCISDSAVWTVIPGMISCEEVMENTAAADLAPLTKEESAAICEIYRSRIFYDPEAKGTPRPEGSER
jgi:aryl-alcohol dehydrogenase-like predicted oxidoreductase